MLKINDLTITVDTAVPKTIVDGVDLEIQEQTITALVGGSGSGKTTTGLAILRLLSEALRVVRGRIHFQGNNVLQYSQRQMHALRGKAISMVFQEPLNAFNPVFPIGSQIEEVLVYHTDLTALQRRRRVLELLALVGIPDSGRVAGNYAHQLSGGLRQRAMIAQAIAADPHLIIADEPTSNLDVTLQARIIELFKQLRAELKLSILLITHDLGVVSHLADEISVITEGKIVEKGSTRAVMSHPQHPYTQKLMAALEV